MAELHSTDRSERRIPDIKLRISVLDIFPNDPMITQLVWAVLLEQNNGWCVQKGLNAVGGLQGGQRYSVGQAVGRNQLNGESNGQHRDELHHIVGHDHGIQRTHW